MNCGKACGSQWGFDSAIGVVTESVPDWTVLFIPEVDAFLDSRLARPSSHLTFPHWPGEGSFAMQVCIRSAARHLVQDVIWLNRCGAVHFFQRSKDLHAGINLYLVVVHNSHGDFQDEVILDVADLVRQKPLGADVCIIGDWKIDQLPANGADPWSEKLGRSAHHRVSRTKLAAFLDRHSLELATPANIMSSP